MRPPARPAAPARIASALASNSESTGGADAGTFAASLWPTPADAGSSPPADARSAAVTVAMACPPAPTHRRHLGYRPALAAPPRQVDRDDHRQRQQNDEHRGQPARRAPDRDAGDDLVGRLTSGDCTDAR